MKKHTLPKKSLTLTTTTLRKLDDDGLGLVGGAGPSYPTLAPQCPIKTSQCPM